MRKLIASLFRHKQAFRPGPAELPRLILTEPIITALQASMKSGITQGKEEIAYLLGLTDGTTTLIVSIIRPPARTTWGSFWVSSKAMAQIVRTAVGLGLQVAGQAHTHPSKAFHSEGDDKGARIAYNGYVSLVLPDYGRHLPALTGAAAYFFRTESGFVEIDPGRIFILPGQIA